MLSNPQFWGDQKFHRGVMNSTHGIETPDSANVVPYLQRTPPDNEETIRSDRNTGVTGRECESNRESFLLILSSCPKNLAPRSLAALH